MKFWLLTNNFYELGDFVSLYREASPIGVTEQEVKSWNEDYTYKYKYACEIVIDVDHIAQAMTCCVMEDSFSGFTGQVLKTVKLL